MFLPQVLGLSPQSSPGGILKLFTKGPSPFGTSPLVTCLSLLPFAALYSYPLLHDMGWCAYPLLHDMVWCAYPLLNDMGWCAYPLIHDMGWCAYPLIHDMVWCAYPLIHDMVCLSTAP